MKGMLKAWDKQSEPVNQLSLQEVEMGGQSHLLKQQFSSSAQTHCGDWEVYVKGSASQGTYTAISINERKRGGKNSLHTRCNTHKNTALSYHLLLGITLLS